MEMGLVEGEAPTGVITFKLPENLVLAQQIPTNQA